MSPSQQQPDTKELLSVTYDNDSVRHKESSGTRKRKRTKTAKPTVETSSVAPAPAPAPQTRKPGPVTVKSPPPSTIKKMCTLEEANSEIEEALELLSLLSRVGLRDRISPHSPDRRIVISPEEAAQEMETKLNTAQASEKDMHARNRDEGCLNAMRKEVNGQKNLDLEGLETTEAPKGVECDEDELDLKFFETFEVLGEDDRDNNGWEIIDEDEDKEDFFELI